MLCKIADLFVEISEAGGIAPRCVNYMADCAVDVDIIIDKELYKPERWKGLSYEQAVYMDSGLIFYAELLKFDGMMLHASAVELDGKAYLFSGPSGMGKSTHARLWQQIFSGARVFNDDKPALRKLDGVWYAYGTPWCGKDGININLKVPLEGICFLRRGEKNEIRRLSPLEAASAIISQTLRRFSSPKGLALMTDTVDSLTRDIPVFELRCRPDTEAAIMSYKALNKSSREVKNEDKK